MAARPAAPDLESLRLVTVTGATTVEIRPTAGLNTQILEVWVDGPADRSHVDVTVGTTLIGRFPVKWNDCLFFAPFTGSIENISFFGLLREIFGPDVFIEADESETITFTFSAAPTAVHVLYRHTSGTIDKTKPLRSRQARTPFVPIITHNATINATGNFALDTHLRPTGFPEIRNGAVIPSGLRFILKALAFGSTSAGNTVPTFAHIWRKTFELFTPITHQGVSVHPSRNLLLFDVRFKDVFTVPDYAFEAGDTITLNFDATYDGSNTIPAQRLALFLIGWLEGGR